MECTVFRCDAIIAYIKMQKQSLIIKSHRLIRLVDTNYIKVNYNPYASKQIEIQFLKIPL